MASTSYHGFNYTGYRSPIYFRTETSLREGEPRSIDFQQAWKQHKVAWSLEQKVARKFRLALLRKHFGAWLGQVRKRKKKKSGEQEGVKKHKDIGQLMSSLSAAIGELGVSSKEVDPQPARESDTEVGATDERSIGTPLKTLESLGNALALSDSPQASPEAEPGATELGVETEDIFSKAAPSGTANEDTERSEDEGKSWSVALGISIDVNAWLLRRRCWYTLLYSFNKWKERSLAFVEDEEGTFNQEQQQIDPNAHFGDERCPSPCHRPLELQRADTPEVDLLRCQLESLLKDKSTLKEENDHLQKENQNLHEVVHYMSTSATVSAACSPAPLVCWQDQQNRSGIVGTTFAAKEHSVRLTGRSSPCASAGVPSSPLSSSDKPHADSDSAVVARMHSKFSNAEAFYRSQSPVKDKEKEKKKVEEALDLDKLPRVPKLARAFFQKL